MNRLSSLTERLEKYEKELVENELWMNENFFSLPSSVQIMILRGVVKTKRNVKEFKVYVETEKAKGECKC